MAQQHINYGASPNDGTGDTLRASQQKAESNFNELYAMVNGGFSKTQQWTGSDITVPAGFSGTVYNISGSKFVTYSVAGTNLTPETGAESGDILLLTAQ